MYIYSNLNGVDEEGTEIWDWSKCNVEEIEGASYYTLEVENIECKEYEYSAALINNNEEIPDASGLTSDWWTSHRVDYNDNPGENSSFTPDEDYFTEDIEEPTIYIDKNAKASSLSSILPESGYLISNANQSFTLSLDLTYDGASVTCPDFGSLYIIGGWHLSSEGGWDEWDKLTYNSVTGLYETTLSTDDLIYAATYSYDICFVYDNQTFDWWVNKVTNSDRSLKLSWTESETLSHTGSCALDKDLSSLPQLSRGTETNPMTVYFNIVSYSSGDVYQTGYGENLYICGSWDNWNSFYQCEYDDDKVVSYNVVYRVNLPVTSVGSYEFKIVNCYGDSGSWSGAEIVAGLNGGNAQITFDETDIACGYKLVTFYYGGSSANVQ